ncbi:MAG: hypothetical protein K0S06_3972 [Microvirga sp.]|nr:hypothetical protein [Microvirga sp.]
MSSAQHRWPEAVVTDGREAIRRLLSGSAPLGHLSAAEPEDAVAALMQDVGRDEPAFEAFDRACLEALIEFRSSILALKRPPFDVALSRLASLVNIIRRMRPKQTVVDLHKNYVTWNAFFSNFVLDRGLDLRREFLRILTLTQHEAEAAGLAPRRLMPLWLSICSESGGTGLYDESYLRVALLGLRRLPLGEEFSSNEDFALQGLARWAAARNPSKAAFLREWRVLEGDFPRGADFWPPRVEQAIAAAERELSERTRHRRETFPAAAWWRDDVEVTSVRQRRTSAAMEPPPRETLEQILRKVNDPIASFSAAIDRLIAGHRRYADATGDVFYLVRTACNIGMRLIYRGQASEREARGEIAVRLARIAFDYDPSNVFAWSLIRDGFRAAGRSEDAELIGWEALRRFPEDPQWPTQLAPVLAEDLGRPEEAAALLRESVSLFPADAHSYTQLATILATHLDRAEEAAALLAEAASRVRENAFVRTQLATVLADDLGRHLDAKTVLETAQRDGAADEVTSSLLRKLSQGRPLRAEHRRSGAPPISRPSHPRIDLPTAVARRALYRFEHGLSNIDAVRELLSRHAPDAYLAYVGERTGARPAPLKTTFALAFEDAARKGSAAALQALIRQTRPLETILVRQAIAAAEDRLEAEDSQDSEAGAAERIVDLTRHLSGNDAPLPPYRLLLLRDTAASLLSTDVLRLAA